MSDRDDGSVGGGSNDDVFEDDANDIVSYHLGTLNDKRISLL